MKISERLENIEESIDEVSGEIWSTVKRISDALKDSDLAQLDSFSIEDGQVQVSGMVGAMNCYEHETRWFKFDVFDDPNSYIQERLREKAKKEKEKTENEEAHELRLLAKLKAKYES